MNMHVSPSSATVADRSRTAKTSTPDPIFSQIEAHKRSRAAAHELQEELDLAESEARKSHSHRPFELISWRNYSAIGGAEIEDRREEFLRLPGIDPEAIEKEYLDAKARERAAIRAGHAWDKRTGLATKRQEYDRAFAAEQRAAMRLAKTEPTTPAGVAALIKHVIDSEVCAEIDWNMTALNTAVAALSSFA